MPRRFPGGFLLGFLATRKVSCFPCTVSCQGFRKLFTQTRIIIERKRFPRPETVSTPGNQEFPESFLKGFLFGGLSCPTR